MQVAFCMWPQLPTSTWQKQKVFLSLSLQPSCIRVLSEAALTHYDNPTSLPSLVFMLKKTPALQPCSGKPEVYLSNNQPSDQPLKSCRTLANLIQRDTYTGKLPWLLEESWAAKIFRLGPHTLLVWVEYWKSSQKRVTGLKSNFIDLNQTAWK